MIDSSSATTLENVARELAENRDPEELHASVHLEGIAYAPLHQLHDILGLARAGLQSS